MVNLTPRLGLELPETPEEYSLAQWNSNWTKLDADLGGAVICTSSTRPLTENYPGRVAFETDTGHLIIRNSTNDGWNLGTQVLTATTDTLPTVTIPGMLAYLTDSECLVMRNVANSAWNVRLHGRTYYQTENVTTTTSSDTYTNGAGGVTPGLAFVAPPSGEVVLHYSAAMLPGEVGTNNACFFAPSVKTGSAVDLGTVVVTPSDNDAITHALAAGSASQVTRMRFGGHRMLPSLVPGSNYNIKMKVKIWNSAGVAGTWTAMKLIVQPA